MTGPPYIYNDLHKRFPLLESIHRSLHDPQADKILIAAWTKKSLPEQQQLSFPKSAANVSGASASSVSNGKTTRGGPSTSTSSVPTSATSLVPTHLQRKRKRKGATSGSFVPVETTVKDTSTVSIAFAEDLQASNTSIVNDGEPYYVSSEDEDEEGAARDQFEIGEGEEEDGNEEPVTGVGAVLAALKADAEDGDVDEEFIDVEDESIAPHQFDDAEEGDEDKIDASRAVVACEHSNIATTTTTTTTATATETKKECNGAVYSGDAIWSWQYEQEQSVYYWSYTNANNSTNKQHPPTETLTSNTTNQEGTAHENDPSHVEAVEAVSKYWEPHQAWYGSYGWWAWDQPEFQTESHRKERETLERPRKFMRTQGVVDWSSEGDGVMAAVDESNKKVDETSDAALVKEVQRRDPVATDLEPATSNDEEAEEGELEDDGTIPMEKPAQEASGKSIDATMEYGQPNHTNNFLGREFSLEELLEDAQHAEEFFYNDNEDPDYTMESKNSSETVGGGASFSYANGGDKWGNVEGEEEEDLVYDMAIEKDKVYDEAELTPAEIEIQRWSISWRKKRKSSVEIMHRPSKYDTDE
jgi:hypothetical protein